MASTMFLISIVLLSAAMNAGAIPNYVRVFDTDIEVPKRCIELLKQYNESKNKSSDESTEQSKHFFCDEEPTNYPKDEVDYYVQKLKNVVFPEQEQTDYTRDSNCEFKEGKNCCSKSSYVTPSFVLTNDELKLVIQSKFFKQTIKQTMCNHTNAPCFKDFNPERYGVRTTCKTDYGTMKLFAYNPKTKSTDIVTISPIPVSCSCHMEDMYSK